METHRQLDVLETHHCLLTVLTCPSHLTLYKQMGTEHSEHFIYPDNMLCVQFEGLTRLSLDQRIIQRQ